MRSKLKRIGRRKQTAKWRLAWSHRIAMQVRIYVRYNRSTYYPVCPRCDESIDRTYMGYCDRCGQKLGWDKLDDVQYRSTKNKGGTLYRKRRIRATLKRSSDEEGLYPAIVGTKG